MFFCDINIPSNLGYVCFDRIFDRNYISRPHWHGFIELEFFIEGKGTHTYNGTTYQIKKGDFWVLSTNDSHQLNISEGIHNVNIALDSSILNDELLLYLSNVHPIHCRFSEAEIPSLLQKVRTLCDEQENPSFLTKVKTSALINEILVEAFRKSPPTQTPIRNSVVNDMTLYLQTHYQENISLAELALKFSFTPNYCGHLFKKVTGLSFNDYINNVRLKCSCNLLLNSELSIKEIAFESGFCSLEHFYSVFKKFYGITPAKYRALSPPEIVQTKSPKNVLV